MTLHKVRIITNSDETITSRRWNPYNIEFCL